jgi:hypothetical protein
LAAIDWAVARRAGAWPFDAADEPFVDGAGSESTSSAASVSGVVARLADFFATRCLGAVFVAVRAAGRVVFRLLVAKAGRLLKLPNYGPTGVSAPSRAMPRLHGIETMAR